jgi:hypothetical protein
VLKAIFDAAGGVFNDDARSFINLLDGKGCIPLQLFEGFSFLDGQVGYRIRLRKGSSLPSKDPR